MKLRLAAPIVIVAVFVVGGAVGAALAAQSAVEARGVRADPAPRPLQARRADHLTYGNETLYDIAFETCESYELSALAARYDVLPEPIAVAQAFAAGYELSFREGAYTGCLGGLGEH